MLGLLQLAACTSDKPATERPVHSEPLLILTDADEQGAIIATDDGYRGVSRRGVETWQYSNDLPYRYVRCASKCPVSVASGSLDSGQVLAPVQQNRNRLVHDPYGSRSGDLVYEVFNDKSFFGVRKPLGEGAGRQAIVVVVNGKEVVRVETGNTNPYMVSSDDGSRGLVFVADETGRPSAYAIDVSRRPTIRKLPGEWSAGCVAEDVTVLVGAAKATIYRKGVKTADVPISESAGCHVGAQSFSLVTLKTADASTTTIRTFDFAGHRLWSAELEGLAKVDTDADSDLLVGTVGGEMRLWDERGSVVISKSDIADARLLDGWIVMLLAEGEVVWRRIETLMPSS
ncbi:hypothetical protein ACIRN4_13290 [Pimelobacter simplex]|uniref:hypothetical protein n=1 Tax=Nocardioides simplex TaxID=2045 RepID=UPI00381913F5